MNRWVHIKPDDGKSPPLQKARIVKETDFRCSPEQLAQFRECIIEKLGA